MQYAGGQERYGKEEQQCPVKIALRLVRSGCREAPLPAGAPSQGDRQQNGETRAQGVSRPDEDEGTHTQQQRNALESQVESMTGKTSKNTELASLNPKQTAGAQ